MKVLQILPELNAGGVERVVTVLSDYLVANGHESVVVSNGGRLVAAVMLIVSASLKARPGMDLRMAVTILSLIYLIGIVIAVLLPETRGRALEE